MLTCTRCRELGRSGATCEYCVARPISSPAQMEVPSHRVRAALASRGVVVRQRVNLELRSFDAIRRSYPDASDSLQGLTRYACDADGRLVGRQCITIRSGLPLVEFEACLAHELVHLALIEHKAVHIPPLLDEGMAEYVSYRYLVDDVRAAPAQRSASRMLRRTRDVYADGLEIVSRTVDEIGFAGAWDALVTGRYRLSDRWMQPTAGG